MAAWRVVDGILDDPRPVEVYQRGGLGPDAANQLLGDDWSWITR